MTDESRDPATGKHSCTPIPVGTHVIPIPPHVGEHLKSLAGGQRPSVQGTRVSICRLSGSLELHLGDVDTSTSEE